MINTKMTPEQRVIANRFYNTVWITSMMIIIASIFNSFVLVAVGVLTLFEACVAGLVCATVLLWRANEPSD